MLDISVANREADAIRSKHVVVWIIIRSVANREADAIRSVDVPVEATS